MVIDMVLVLRVRGRVQEGDGGGGVMRKEVGGGG